MTTRYAEQKAERIRDMLANPRRPGKWWAEEIVAKADRGERVLHSVLEVAKDALKGRIDRVPGEDDE